MHCSYYLLASFHDNIYTTISVWLKFGDNEELFETSVQTWMWYKYYHENSQINIFSIHDAHINAQTPATPNVRIGAHSAKAYNITPHAASGMS